MRVDYEDRFKVTRVDLSSVEFEFGFGQYRLVFSGVLADASGQFAFFWSAKDSKLQRVIVKQANGDSHSLFEYFQQA